MQYISTRGDLKTNFSESVLWGLTPEGGLLIPESFPKYSNEDLKEIINNSYSKELFNNKQITPVKLIDKETYVLELFHGPTLAFKDIALQFLGNMFDYILKKMNSSTNILTATSGDTGSAAIHGILGKERLRIFVLTPEGKMSQFQTAQMYSVIDKNVFNIAVNGTFDDCQDMVKKVSEDTTFRDKYRLGYMNSINWTRILAQIVYYAKGIFEIQKENNLTVETKVDVSVPTGNFGDILAGYYAKKIGIPIGRLILATNENNVLDNFFKNGIYKIRNKEEVIPTDSPSMDITSASNFERYVYDIVEKDPGIVRTLWKEIKEKKFFDISKTKYFLNVKKGEVVSGFATKKDRYDCIKNIYKEKNYIIDPHTANGVFVAKKYKNPGTFMLCLATASPAKFEESIKEALQKDIKLERPKNCIDIEKKSQKFIRIERMDTESLRKFIETNALD